MRMQDIFFLSLAPLLLRARIDILTKIIYVLLWCPEKKKRNEENEHYLSLVGHIGRANEEETTNFRGTCHLWQQHFYSHFALWSPLRASRSGKRARKRSAGHVRLEYEWKSKFLRLVDDYVLKNGHLQANNVKRTLDIACHELLIIVNKPKQDAQRIIIINGISNTRAIDISGTELKILALF